MDVVVEEVVDIELTKVMAQVNKELVKEFNETLLKVHLCKVNKKLVVVMDVVVDEVVTKVKKLVKEVNEVLVLVHVDVVMVVEVIIKLTVVIEMMWCWTRRLTWRSTRRWPTLSTSRCLGSFGYFWRKC